MKSKHSMLGGLKPLIDDKSAYSGLRCLAWRASGDASLKVELINFAKACDDLYSCPAYSTAEGQIEIHIHSPPGPQAPCGAELFDCVIEIEDVPLGSGIDLSITSDEVTESSDKEVLYHQIDVDQLAPDETHVICGYTYSAGHDWEGIQGKDGTAHFGPHRGEGESGCDEGLTLHDCLCLPTCTQDSDCPIEDQMTCEDGICLLSNGLAEEQEARREQKAEAHRKAAFEKMIEEEE